MINDCEKINFSRVFRYVPDVRMGYDGVNIRQRMKSTMLLPSPSPLLPPSPFYKKWILWHIALFW